MALALDTTVLTYALAALLFLSFALGAWVIRLELKLKRLLIGKNARSLEDTIRAMIARVHELEEFQKGVEEYTRDVERRLSRSIQSIETIRFNPFESSHGGNQSFATAFLSEHGDGVVISSLYARDRMSVYAKPVRDQKSSFELSDEERQALKAAAKQLEK